MDESLITVRGRLSYIQFNPAKRARFGLKVYIYIKPCDFKTGYCYNFKVFTGKEVAQQPIGEGAADTLISEQVATASPTEIPNEVQQNERQ